MEYDRAQRAQIARVVNALRAGDDNDEGDQVIARAVEDAFPGARQMIAWCDRFSAEAARLASAAELTGVIFGNHGFPAAAPHRVVSPRTWCAYADGDEAVADARAMEIAYEGGDVPAIAVRACVTEPWQVMADIEARGFPQGPVQAQLGLAPAMMPEPGAAAVVARWAWKLRKMPGSQIAALVPLHGYLGLPSLFGEVSHHTAADVTGWFEAEGLRLIRPVADVRAWSRQGWGETSLRVSDDTHVVAAVARVG